MLICDMQSKYKVQLYQSLQRGTICSCWVFPMYSSEGARIDMVRWPQQYVFQVFVDSREVSHDTAKPMHPWVDLLPPDTFIQHQVLPSLSNQANNADFLLSHACLWHICSSVLASWFTLVTHSSELSIFLNHLSAPGAAAQLLLMRSY